MSFDPAALILLLGVGGLYWRAVWILSRRGRRVARWQQAAFAGGLGLTAVALLGPLDPLAEDLLAAHMGQHVLLADLSAPLLVAGLRTPVVQFFLPRSVMVAVSRRRRLRRVLGTLRRPLPALGLYVLLLYGWHLAPAFEGALRSPALHALQHESFVLGNVLVWWAVLEPGRARLPGELWKIGHIMAARLASIFLGMGLIFSRSPWYGGFYGDRAREHGLTPVGDQQFAGGIMMSLDILIVLFALSLFFWRAAADHDRAERAESLSRAT